MQVIKPMANIGPRRAKEVERVAGGGGFTFSQMSNVRGKKAMLISMRIIFAYLTLHETFT